MVPITNLNVDNKAIGFTAGFTGEALKTLLKEKGINAALFKVRVIKNFLNAITNQAYSFFLGAVLCQEIEYILSIPQEKVIIGGKAQIKMPMEILLKQNSNKEIIALDEEITKTATAKGIIKIFEYE